MFRVIVFFAAVIVVSESACWTGYFIGSECEYRDQIIEGTDVSIEDECLVCSCTEGVISTLSCCHDGPIFTTYPEACKKRINERGCEELVLKRDESIECTTDEGHIAGVGR